MTNNSRKPIALMAVITCNGYALGCLAVEPAPIKAGNWDLVPTLNTRVSHTDNLLYQPEDEISSVYFLTNPKIQAILRNNADEYSLEAEAFNGEFSATSVDDYTDWRVGGSAHVELNEDNIVNLSASLDDTHELRGTNFSQGQTIPREPDRYDEMRVNGSYQLGSRAGRTSVIFNARYYDKHYRNNRQSTYYRDRTDVAWGTMFYLNLSPRTSMFLEYSSRDARYAHDPDPGTMQRGTLDNTTDSAFVGFEWEPTSKTATSAKFGYMKKEFEDPERENTNAPSWDVSVEYSPLSYSVFEFTATRDYAEPSGIGNTVDSMRYGLNWRHEWTARLSSNADISYTVDDYEGFEREDSISRFSTGLSYAFARWFDMSFSVSRNELDSDFPTNRFNFLENRVSVGFEASL